ncbi:hypothetical protein [Hymenobacter persicinus]|uniref:GTPase n=1 Tax=Hymenobacter persicinus TaxID=2025506 RepID=A0A4V1ZB55_9BACT|nr:hypothetical protein [Hymenobacter persicinus]RYU83228.1 hypothetical protein EWM57_02780 [Hymenobacter persicinus]
MPETLLFVYNANAGLLNGMLDLVHKTLSPRTYPCSLCALTYGVSMRPEWKSFIESLPIEARFPHRDEFWAAFPAQRQQPLPAVFRQLPGGELQPFITAAELNHTNLPGLMQLVSSRLSALQPEPVGGELSGSGNF